MTNEIKEMTILCQAQHFLSSTLKSFEVGTSRSFEKERKRKDSLKKFISIGRRVWILYATDYLANYYFRNHIKLANI